MKNESPLVTVGIPTFNRPSGLQKTLECITRQTYRNLEILVSDNCSPGTSTEETVSRFAQQDPRVTYFRQSENRGAGPNFSFLFEKARGDYFMWAADDDIYYDFYVETIVDKFKELSSSRVAAITTEAQYFDGKEMFSYFSEGSAFYDLGSKDPWLRLVHVLENNYGNLFYSVYRRDLLSSLEPIFTQNEIPFLLQVAMRGSFLVLPKIGFLKQTTTRTFEQARWEMEGGRLPGARLSISYYKTLHGTYSYHRLALQSILKSISELSLGEAEKRRLAAAARRKIWTHFLYFVVQYKKAP